MPGGPVVAVAYSGGRDSSALLHATCAAAGPFGITVAALHVHHGLSPQADDWLRHCASVCARWARRGADIRFAAARVGARPRSGDSVEAWAREARYGALARLAGEQGADLVLLAQHRRDQAETFVLQALRGGGLAGLSAMPRLAQRDGIAWARPWLDVPRDAIDTYVRRHRLAHVEDDSNLDPRYARSRMRAKVWPALLDAFPDAETSFARAAAWAQEASQLQDDLVQSDLLACAAETAAADAAGVPFHLAVAAWQQLSQPRRSAVLRSWLRARIGAAAPATLITRLLCELTPQRGRRWPAPGGQLFVHRGRLGYEATASAPEPATHGRAAR